jgi:hypothetical protein
MNVISSHNTPGRSEEARVRLFEPTSTFNKGIIDNERTVTELEEI